VDDTLTIVGAAWGRWGSMPVVRVTTTAAGEIAWSVHRGAHNGRGVAGVTRGREVFEQVLDTSAASALGALTNASGELFDVIEDFSALGHLGQDLALGVHDRGVVAAERLADLG
jgi:hypothetical protein